MTKLSTQSLSSLSSKNQQPMVIAGFMSGTSLDGVDVSVIETDGSSVLRVLEELTVPYSLSFQEELRGHLGTKELTPELVQTLQQLMDIHAEAFHKLACKEEVDLVSIHGQTIFHIPRKNGVLAQTWQAADPEYLQSLIHKPIVFDLRGEDITQGGEGAPLVPIYHLALMKDQEKPLAMVNIGGVANLTWIPSSNENELMAGDTGPGMALLNDLIQKHQGISFDPGGHFAAMGSSDGAFIEKVLADPFFEQSLPKSLDRDYFKDVLVQLEKTTQLPQDLYNALHTLCEITAQGILKAFPDKPQQIILSGGGRKHLVIKKLLQEALSIPVRDIDELGINGDFIEAQAWAFLAARHVYKLSYTFPKTTGVRYPTCGGRLLAVD